MDPFNVLRIKAATKRDAALQAARDQYKHDLEAIQSLARQLPGELPTAPPPTTAKRSIEALILDLVPPDRPFTIDQMMGWLRATDPNRKVHPPTIRSTICKLRRDGVIRRLQKTHGNRTMWIGTKSTIQPGPFSEMPMREVVKGLLRECGAMTKTDLVVAFHERHYRTEFTKRQLMLSIHQLFQRDAKQFRRRFDGKWEIARKPK